MTMPGMTGEGLARELRKIRPDIPIILCTGYSASISEEKAMKKGINAFLLKPVNRGDLAVTLRKVLERQNSGAGVASG
jgi:CheY-like chemotaxis protein